MSQKPANPLSIEQSMSPTADFDGSSLSFSLQPDPAGSKNGSSVGSSVSQASRFQLKRLLGSGAFGTVTLAWDETLQREVAIKRPNPTASPNSKCTFLNEAQLAARIKHPGVVVVHDFGIDEDSQPFVVYEYLAGTSLREQINGKPPWDQAHTLQLGLALAEALVAIHRVGLTHRDLKPANVLIDAEGRPHIVDFGLAIEEESQSERQGEISGTFRYMSPEQVRGEAHLVDGRTDLWSLGVILYQLLTGKLPFYGEGKDQIFVQILGRNPRPPRQWQVSISKRVEQLVLSLLAKPIDQRPASASDVVTELKSCLADLTSASPPATRVPSANSTLFVTSLALLIVVFPLLLVSLYRPLFPHANPMVDVGEEHRVEVVPPTSSYPVGVWTQLLREEPAAMIIHADDQITFDDGTINVDAKYQVVVRLGEVRAPNYAFRVTVEPETWSGDAGLFVGWGPSEEIVSADAATMLGIWKVDEQTSILPKRIHFQRDGLQLPVKTETLPGIEKRVDQRQLKSAVIHLEVQDGCLVGIFLNSQKLNLDPWQSSTAPMQGIFGLYVIRGKCRFRNPEIRILEKVQQ